MNNTAVMTRPLRELRYAAIDFESAGVHPGETDQPVQVGIVTADELNGDMQHYMSYLACDRPIHWAASQVHGIQKEDLHDAPAFTSLWPEFKKRLSDRVLVAHNYGTEYKFLQRFPAHGFAPWLDTLTLVRRALPEASDHSLGAVCELLGITDEVRAAVPRKNWHDAHFDAAASLLLLRYIIRELGMEEYSLSDISFAVKKG